MNSLTRTLQKVSYNSYDSIPWLLLFPLLNTISPCPRCTLLPLKKLSQHSFFCLHFSQPNKLKQSFLSLFSSKVWTAHENPFGLIVLLRLISTLGHLKMISENRSLSTTLSIVWLWAEKEKRRIWDQNRRILTMSRSLIFTPSRRG